MLRESNVMLMLLRKLLREFLFGVPRPGPMYVFYRERSMGNRFQVTAIMPDLPSDLVGEVTKRRLKTTINGAVVSDDTFDVSETQRVFEALQDDTVDLELYNIDDANNESGATTKSFVVIDNIPPPEPGEIDVALAELPDAPAPAPEPEPDPAPEPENPPE